MNVKSIAKAQENASETFLVGQGVPTDSSTNDNKERKQVATNESTTNVQVPASTTDTKGKKKDTGLPEELSELVSELKETVRQINPKKHTKKTLRRTLATINDILDDLNRLTTTKSPA
jgi:clumping factor A